MNIKARNTIVVTSVLVTAGALDMLSGRRVIKASIDLFDNPAIKWGAIITGVVSAIAGVVYLLASKDALKRKVIEYGEVGFVVVNGHPKRYRFGKRKGSLVIRTEGQAKNIIPKLRDVVTVSWLEDILVVRNLKMVYNGRRLGYDLSIEYSLPPLRDKHDDATKELLANMVFGFRDLNRYNEQLGTLVQHLELRCTEQVPPVLARCEANGGGVPMIQPDEVDWMNILRFHELVTLASIRVSPINMDFVGQIEVK